MLFRSIIKDHLLQPGFRSSRCRAGPNPTLAVVGKGREILVKEMNVATLSFDLRLLWDSRNGENKKEIGSNTAWNCKV